MNRDLSQKIILLADDDPDDAEMFAEVLKDIDPSVNFYHVKTGLAVFDYLQSHDQPTLIFLDINMPEMSGWECLVSLKKDPKAKDIPVLIYSTSSHQRDKQTATDLGAAAFITKPSDYKILRQILTLIAANIDKDITVAINNLP